MWLQAGRCTHLHNMLHSLHICPSLTSNPCVINSPQLMGTFLNSYILIFGNSRNIISREFPSLTFKQPFSVSHLSMAMNTAPHVRIKAAIVVPVPLMGRQTIIVTLSRTFSLAHLPIVLMPYKGPSSVCFFHHELGVVMVGLSSQ